MKRRVLVTYLLLSLTFLSIVAPASTSNASLFENMSITRQKTCFSPLDAISFSRLSSEEFKSKVDTGSMKHFYSVSFDEYTTARHSQAPLTSLDTVHQSITNGKCNSESPSQIKNYKTDKKWQAFLVSILVVVVYIVAINHGYH